RVDHRAPRSFPTRRSSDLHCPEDGVVPVPEDQLPVVLPLDVEITGKGRSPLENVPEFVNVTCPKCGGPAHFGHVTFTNSGTFSRDRKSTRLNSSHLGISYA